MEEEEDSIDLDLVNAFERRVSTLSVPESEADPKVEIESLRRQLEEEKQRRAKLNAELLRARNGSSSSSGLTADIKLELEALRRSHQMRMEESNITGRLLDAKDEALALAARAAQDAEFQNECLRGDVEELKTKLASLKGLSAKKSAESTEEEEEEDDDDDDSMLVPPTPPAQGSSRKVVNKESPALLALLEEKNKLEQELTVIENRHEKMLEKLENENDGLRRDRNSLRKERDALKTELDSVRGERDSLKNALLGAVHRGNDTAKSRDEFISRAVAEAKREVESELVETKHLLEEASAFGRALLVANKELEKQIMYQNEEAAVLPSIPPSASKQLPLPSMETLLSPKAPPPPSSSSSLPFSSNSTTAFLSTLPSFISPPTPTPITVPVQTPVHTPVVKSRQGTSESSLKDLTDSINATLASLSSPQPSRPLPPPHPHSYQPSLLSSPRFTLPPSASPAVTSASRPPLFTSASGSKLASTENGHDYLARRMLMEARGVEERERARRKVAEEEIEQLQRAITGR